MILCPPTLMPRSRATHVQEGEVVISGSEQKVETREVFLCVPPCPLWFKPLRPALRSLLATSPIQRHWNLFHNLDAESFQAGNLARMIRKQPYAPQIQVRQDLRADANFALGLALALRQRRQTFVAMKRER